LKFSSFFDSWLFGDGGYYTKYREIGKSGDFYTSVSSSIFFGGSIANYIVRLINNNIISDRVLICEIGAHKGYMMADIIQFIFTINPSLLDTLSFAIVERFDDIRDTQREYLSSSFGNSIKIDYLNSITDIKQDEIFFVSNEIFDCFSCELINQDKMAFVDNNRIFFDEVDNEILSIANEYNITKGEVPIGISEFAKSISKFEKVIFLSFDYGEIYPYQDFSVRVFKNHQLFNLFEIDNILDYYKISDITYSVNFDIIDREFTKVGMKRELFKTQMDSLVYFGIADLLNILQSKVDYNTYLIQVAKIKNLISPSNMGEKFKAIEFRKNI
jgi:SAM-dependent MidA family methyltransferase